MAFELPKLPYAEDALEPHFDKETMNIQSRIVAMSFCEPRSCRLQLSS